MAPEIIEKFIENKTRKGTPVNIHFKERGTVTGMFIQGSDYNELKAKNFWRIVSSASLGEWKKTEDINLTRIFNGISFTRLTD